MNKEVVSINSTHDPTYPVLDRQAFLIERACVPRYMPVYCAEAGQLFAALADYLHKKNTEGGAHNEQG